MRIRGKTFRLNKEEGKLLGVCAGIADYAGIDATIVRIAVVLATLIFPWTALVYGAAAFLGRPRGAAHLGDWRAEDSDERMRSLDLRMQAIETCVASENSQLAREIEDLRTK